MVFNIFKDTNKSKSFNSSGCNKIDRSFDVSEKRYAVIEVNTDIVNICIVEIDGLDIITLTSTFFVMPVNNFNTTYSLDIKVELNDVKTEAKIKELVNNIEKMLRIYNVTKEGTCVVKLTKLKDAYSGKSIDNLCKQFKNLGYRIFNTTTEEQVSLQVKNAIKTYNKGIILNIDENIMDFTIYEKYLMTPH